MRVNNGLEERHASPFKKALNVVKWFEYINPMTEKPIPIPKGPEKKEAAKTGAPEAIMSAAIPVAAVARVDALRPRVAKEDKMAKSVPTKPAAPADKAPKAAAKPTVDAATEKKEAKKAGDITSVDKTAEGDKKVAEEDAKRKPTLATTPPAGPAAAAPAKTAAAPTIAPPAVVGPPAGRKTIVTPGTTEPYVTRAGTPEPAPAKGAPTKPDPPAVVPPAPVAGAIEPTTRGAAEPKLTLVKPTTTPPTTPETPPPQPPSPPETPEQPPEAAPEKEKKSTAEATIRFDKDPYEDNVTGKENVGLIHEMTPTQFKQHLTQMFDAHFWNNQEDGVAHRKDLDFRAKNPSYASPRSGRRSRDRSDYDARRAFVNANRPEIKQFESLRDMVAQLSGDEGKLDAILDRIVEDIFVNNDEFQRGTVNYYRAYERAWQIYLTEMKQLGSQRDRKNIPVFASGAFDQTKPPGIYHNGELVGLPSNLGTGAGYHESAVARTGMGIDRRYGEWAKDGSTRIPSTIYKPPKAWIEDGRETSLDTLVDARYRSDVTRTLINDLGLKGPDGKTPITTMKGLEKAVIFKEETAGDIQNGIPQVLTFTSKAQYLRGEVVPGVHHGIVRIDKVPGDPKKSEVATMEFEKVDGILKTVLNDSRYQLILNDQYGRIFTEPERTIIRDSSLMPKKSRDWRYYDQEPLWNLCSRGGSFDQIKKVVETLDKNAPDHDWLGALGAIINPGDTIDPVAFIKQTEQSLREGRVDPRAAKAILDIYCAEYFRDKTWKQVKIDRGVTV